MIKDKAIQYFSILKTTFQKNFWQILFFILGIAFIFQYQTTTERQVRVLEYALDDIYEAQSRTAGQLDSIRKEIEVMNEIICDGQTDCWINRYKKGYSF